MNYMKQYDSEMHFEGSIAIFPPYLVDEEDLPIHRTFDEETLSKFLSAPELCEWAHRTSFTRMLCAPADSTSMHLRPLPADGSRTPEAFSLGTDNGMMVVCYLDELLADCPYLEDKVIMFNDKPNYIENEAGGRADCVMCIPAFSGDVFLSEYDIEIEGKVLNKPISLTSCKSLGDERYIRESDMPRPSWIK